MTNFIFLNNADPDFLSWLPREAVRKIGENLQIVASLVFNLYRGGAKIGWISYSDVINCLKNVSSTGSNRAKGLDSMVDKTTSGIPK